MSDAQDPVVEAAKVAAREIVVRFYDDAIGPTARFAGSQVEELMRTMSASGLEFGIVARERIEALLRRAIERVPKERRILPPPQILGPVLEKSRYEPEGSPLIEMFEELLSRSMDAEHVDEAHPAFPGLISQLSYQEAVMLRELQQEGPWTTTFQVGSGDTVLPDPIQFTNDMKRHFLMSHLLVLGLTEMDYEKGGPTHRPLLTYSQTTYYRLSPVGAMFLAACTRPDEMAEPRQHPWG